MCCVLVCMCVHSSICGHPRPRSFFCPFSPMAYLHTLQVERKTSGDESRQTEGIRDGVKAVAILEFSVQELGRAVRPRKRRLHQGCWPERVLGKPSGTRMGALHTAVTHHPVQTLHWTGGCRWSRQEVMLVSSHTSSSAQPLLRGWVEIWGEAAGSEGLDTPHCASVPR